ncbi:MAG: FABP family protein [Arenicella sp.]
MKKLTVFIGIWKGVGQGIYPTIEPFDYQKTLRFEPDAEFSLLHYEQQANVIAPSVSCHWESGFVRPLEGGFIQISNSQNSGRVEVLQGRLEVDGQITRLDLSSLLIDNDSRMAETRRIFEVRDDSLQYTVSMATHTTPIPELQPHLSASLVRLSPRE